jgi:L-ascorbate metabolism protein UlaG (beta-lactamase superfamily)
MLLNGASGMSRVSFHRWIRAVAWLAQGLLLPDVAGAQDAVISREEFLKTEWRLTGMIFPMMTPGGYPIVFHPDGALITENLSGARSWSLDGGQLTLSGTRRPFYRFRWAPHVRAFLSCEGKGVPSMIISPHRSHLSLNVPCHEARTGSAGNAAVPEVSLPTLVPQATEAPQDTTVLLRYLGTSGWWIRTPSGSLVIDYVGLNASGDNIGTRMSTLRPSELMDRPVAVIATHEHDDHFATGLLAWADSVPRAVVAAGGPSPLRPRDMRLEPRTSVSVGPARVWTIRSTDSGIGLLARIGDLTIYHAGDHARWVDELDADYRAEIDHLASLGMPVDIAFVPIAMGTRCNATASLRTGAMYAIAKLTPRVTLPMHVRCVDRMGERYREFADAATAAGHVAVAVRAIGEEFTFAGGRLTRRPR